MLHAGQVAPRPPAKRSQAHPGVHPLSSLHRTQRFQPLPLPLGEPPYHYDLASVISAIGKKTDNDGKIVFHTVGDTGGVKNAEYQADVAAEMKDDLNLGAGKAPEVLLPPR